MIYLTKKQMKEVDGKAMEDYKMTVEQLMENVGNNISRFISNLNPDKVSVIYGKGNNGGDGLCVARHVSIHGINVEIIPASDDLNEHSEKQLKILNKMGIEPKNKIDKSTDIIVDALLGYNIKGNPRNRYKSLIEKINKIKNNNENTKIISIDIPSGIDPNTGKRKKPFIKADYTLTLALPKKAMQKTDNFGQIYLVNIGIPNQLYKEMGFNVENYFKDEDVVKV